MMRGQCLHGCWRRPTDLARGYCADCHARTPRQGLAALSTRDTYATSRQRVQELQLCSWGSAMPARREPGRPRCAMEGGGGGRWAGAWRLASIWLFATLSRHAPPSSMDRACSCP